jgi:hypothetical protein
LLKKKNDENWFDLNLFGVSNSATSAGLTLLRFI